MSAPIGPGDLVLCVNAGPIDGGYWEPGAAPVAGAIYTVREVFTDASGTECLDLSEIRRGREAEAQYGFRVGYGVWRFKPIGRPKQELIDSLKAPPKEAPIQQPETVGGSAGFGPRVAARLVLGET